MGGGMSGHFGELGIGLLDRKEKGGEVYLVEIVDFFGVGEVFED